MIGLGDIIVPGFLCSLCIRLDYLRAYKSTKEICKGLT